MAIFKELFKKMTPLNETEKVKLDGIQNLVTKQRFNLITSLLKDKKINIEFLELSPIIAQDFKLPNIIPLSDEIDTSEVNIDIKNKIMKDIFKDFSKKAYDIIPKLIAPNIKGMEYIKKAAALQLFSKQALHILLLGDPGTGKTDVLRSVFQFAPISSFGLGSGTSGVGLVATIKGNKIMKGLLPLADKGICCIDELNLMKEDSRAGLYNAMEKGFVNYDKGGHHHRFDARSKILATANPKGDKFTGKTVEELKSEMPFDSALLTRFHLVFFIKKPDLKKFKEIAKKITSQDKIKIKKGDIEIIKGYINHVMNIEMYDLSKEIQEQIVNFITELKQNENNYLIEISPRQVIGIMRLCNAVARINARDKVIMKDLDIVKDIFKNSLNLE
jgi:replicative DNA helicase Mcm